jgi:hypothetical protein
MTHIDEILDGVDGGYIPASLLGHQRDWPSVAKILAAEVRQLRMIINGQITTQANLTDKVAASREREKRLVEMLRDLLDSGVVDTDPRIRWVELQVDKAELKEAMELLALYNQTGGKEEG